VEEWEKAEDLERHVRTPVFRRLLAVLELSRSPPDVFYVQGGRLRGMEWIEEILGRCVAQNELKDEPEKRQNAARRRV
jgi:hypothetical protein